MSKINYEKTVSELKHIQGLTTLKSLEFPKEREEFHITIARTLELLKAQKQEIEILRARLSNNDYNESEELGEPERKNAAWE